MGTLWQDVRYGLRMLARSPGLTVVAVLSLALGIGANTAIFSVVDALLFKPLPYPQPERLMAVAYDNEQPQGFQFWPYPKYAALRDAQVSFDSVAAYSQLQLSAKIGEQAERIEAEVVTANYFSMLGVQAGLGRVFLPEEDQTPGAHPVVLLGHRLWQQQFGGDPQVIGKMLYLKRQPFTVVGVMPANFRGQSGTAELWVPMMMAGTLLYADALNAQYAWWLKVIARLKPDLTEAQARAEMPILSAKVAELVPAQLNSMLTKSGEERIRLIPLKETKIDPAVKKSFLILLAAVGFVMLIVCVNTASLLLARAVARQREFAVRVALGAGRGRVFRQVLTESVLLAGLGACGGLLVALWGMDWLTISRPWNAVGFWSQYARTFDYFAPGLDTTVFAFNFLLAFVAGIAFGLVPAWQTWRADVNEMLKGSGGVSAASRSLGRVRMRSALVVAEVALSVVLLVSAGLMTRSFLRLLSVPLGFEPEGVVTMAFGGERKPLEFYRAVLERVQGLPGVEQASLGLGIPLAGSMNRGGIQIEGRTLDSSAKTKAAFNVVTPEYFSTFRIAVIKGRSLTAEDRIGAPRVALISRTMAERFWPGEDPIGKRFKTPFRDAYGAANAWIQIVGVVDDVKYGAVEDPAEPTLYLPAWQPLGTPSVLSFAPDSLVIRTATHAAPLIAAVKREMRSIDQAMPVSDVSTMRERAARVTSRYRYGALLMGMFAALGLVLSAIGVYGVMAFSVSARTREFGVRLALGAQPRDILRLVIVKGVVLVLAGVGLGLAGALAITRVLASQLYEVRPTDPVTFFGVSALLIGVGLLACYIPARRATRVEPMVALRYE